MNAPAPIVLDVVPPRIEALRQIERKLLWLSAWAIHNANHLRPNRDGLKVGGHQASCASCISILTALYFSVLRPQDRVAVKPHAGPVFHAINLLFGRQTAERMATLRQFGGLQSYPSRMKDGPDVDFSTGSVGLGVAVTSFAALMQDYVRLHGLSDAMPETIRGRHVAIAGDAELDEGNIYEALLEGWKHDVRNVWWVIDYNRQSLDSVVPDRLFGRIEGLFRDMGWNVVTLKYGRLLEAAFAREGGEALRRWIDDCPNSLYSALTFQGGGAWRAALLAELGREPGVRAILAPVLADRPVAETMPLTDADLAGADIAAYGTRPTLPWREQIAIAADFAAAWHGRVSAAIGPSGPQRCSDDLLVAAADLAARRNLVLHMHVLETRVQRAMGLHLYGRPMLAHLHALGLLTPRANLVHAVWLEPGDIEIIAATGAAVIHNPVSNARLGSGICALPALLRAGVRVGLGTDSACCNDSVNMLETMKWAALLPRLSHNEADWPLPGRALSLATSGAADAIGLGACTGALHPGLAADIALLRLDSPAFVPLHDPVRQLVQGETGAAVDTVLVDGRVVLRHGACTLLDETAIWQEARALSERRLRDNQGVYRDAAALAAPIRRMRARLCGCAEGERLAC